MFDNYNIEWFGYDYNLKEEDFSVLCPIDMPDIEKGELGIE